jgi:hypothetical protein
VIFSLSGALVRSSTIGSAIFTIRIPSNRMEYRRCKEPFKTPPHNVSVASSRRKSPRGEVEPSCGTVERQKGPCSPLIGEPHPDNVTNTDVRAVGLEHCPSLPTVLDIAGVVTFAVRQISINGMVRPCEDVVAHPRAKARIVN